MAPHRGTRHAVQTITNRPVGREHNNRGVFGAQICGWVKAEEGLQDGQLPICTAQPGSCAAKFAQHAEANQFDDKDGRPELFQSRRPDKGNYHADKEAQKGNDWHGVQTSIFHDRNQRRPAHFGRSPDDG